MPFLLRNISDMLSDIQNNPEETQRLVGVKYSQLERLIKQAIALHIEKQQEIEAKKIRFRLLLSPSGTVSLVRLE